jgi:hypothetical protein
MPNEPEMRRPEFTEWQAVTLADGNQWILPRPRLEYVPRVVDGRFRYADVPGRFTFGPDFEWNLIGYRSAADELEKFQELAFVVAGLIRLNYEIGDDDLAELLAVRLDDEDHVSAGSLAMWGGLAEAIVLPADPARVMVPEDERRVRDDTSGSWVTLGDGQAWRFPSPTIHGMTDGDFAALESIQQSDEVLEQASLIAGLAADSLVSAYDLSDEEIARLLPIVRDPVSGAREPSNREMWIRVLDAVSGVSRPERRTRQRWLRLASIVATGNPSLDLAVEDVEDLAAMLVMGGKLAPSHLWVESEIAALEDARAAAGLDGLL